MPSLSYPIQGIVRDSRGRILIGITVSLKNTTKSSNVLPVVTDTSGKYIADAANFSSDYSANDIVSVEAYNSAQDEYKKDTFTITGTSKTLNLNLNVLTDLVQSTGYQVANVLTNVNKKPYSKSNPLTVENEEIRYTKAYDYDSSGTFVVFIGDAPIGSAKTEAKWRIKKLSYSGSNVTDEQWADGNDYFDNVWNDRGNLNYS